MKTLSVAAFATGLALAGAAHAAGPNLVVNGDFEAGNTGFTSDHSYVSPGVNVLYPEGLYTIAVDPISQHSSWVSMGGSNKMIVNGETDGVKPVVWQQQVAVGVGTYNFAAQASNICCNGTYTGPNLPSALNFEYSFDGVTFTLLPPVLLTAPPGDAGTFYNVNRSIYSNAAQNVTLRISNGLTGAGGNDFALDNISLSAVPEPATWAMMITGFGFAGVALRRRRLWAAVA